MDVVLIIAVLIVAAAIVQSALLVLQTWEHRRYARSCMRSHDRCQASGRALVVAPCKGVDVGQMDNLRAIMRQDYDDYEVAFVVESEDDPACAVVRRVMAKHPERRARLVIAGAADESGQKVHNLRAATAAIGRHIDFVAFVDSDARPRRQWLRLLLARLQDDQYGAATGYRWYMPETASPANLLLYSINCGVMMLLGKRSHYLVWGGSWAMRRREFDEIGLHEAWRGTLSDDLVASRVLREAHRPTRFEPTAVVPSPLDMDFGRLMEFVRRQYMVARFYTPQWWLFGLAVLALPNLAWLAIAALVGKSLTAAGPHWAVAVALAIALYGLGAVRGALRQSLVKTYFPEQHRALRAARWFDILGGPLTGLVHWFGMLTSTIGQRISWRGLTYRLYPGGAIELEERPVILPLEPAVEERRKAA